jgi:Protein of unknown function (DUF1036)
MPQEVPVALYFANETDNTVWAAFCYQDSSGGAGAGSFRKIGWWEIPSGQTLTAWDVDLRTVNRYAYFYAESADGAVWAGPGLTLEVGLHAFNQPALESPDDPERADFIELDFAGNYGLGVMLGPRDGQYSLSPDPIPTPSTPGTAVDCDMSRGSA